MKTILVPVDFSSPAKNAALYALKIAEQLRFSRIVFYNAYQAPPIINEPTTMPSIPILDIETLKDISRESMKHFQESMIEFYPADIKVEHLSEYADLAGNINEICEKTNAELIVLGITGTSRIEEVLMGSTAINVAKNTKIPVIIVPSDASFTSIKNIVLACDFKKVVETTPVAPIKSILDSTDALLHVLNVTESDKEVSNEMVGQKKLLNSLFEEYEPTFHFIKNEDFITAINDFVEVNHIDMIITIPKKHGFLSGLFKERHTKKLAFHSHVALMYIHEEDL